MRRLAYILSIALGVGLVSCSKDDIKPTAPSKDAPAWEKALNANQSPTTGTGEGTVSPTDPAGGEITDPNQDEDSNGRKKN